MRAQIFTVSVLFIVGSVRNSVSSDTVDARIINKVCIGTAARMSVPPNRDLHYKSLRDRYTNCTYVDGNLEITWIQNTSYDLNFLQHIREVTGYVLISHVDTKQVYLPRLQIIRGQNLLKWPAWEPEFGLFVAYSKMQTLELPALRDILKGSVNIFNNENLCHIRTIMWNEILSGPNVTDMYTYNFALPERDCPACHSSCEHGCWGEGSENCQKFSKINCAPQCSQGRCFGSKPRECCHLSCAGGCTGPTQKDCLACKNFLDDGECKQECPAMKIYNTNNYLWDQNPKGKYIYGRTCVQNCPEHLLKDSGACVRMCPENKVAENDECVHCNGPCPKKCKSEGIIHDGNIDSFKGCTVIEGNLEILDQTFTGYQHVYSNFSFGPRFNRVHPDRLEIFSSVKEITGYLNIQGEDNDFTNLSYFRNLEVIHGRQLKENFFASLYIVKTSLKSLGLKSLKLVNFGAIMIYENKNLCFVQNWNRIKRSESYENHFLPNRNATECRLAGEVCDSECSDAGCWGKGSDQCLECKKLSYKGTCLSSCKAMANIYELDQKTCSDCHLECKGSCRGPNSTDCYECKNFKIAEDCIEKCPFNSYVKDGICFECHKACNGCAGPRNTLSDDGCAECDHKIMNGTVQKCLIKDTPCPDGFYKEYPGPEQTICQLCHPRCKKCTGYGFHESVCSECKRYRRGEQCEDECAENQYVNEVTNTCDSCHDACQKCRGPGPDNCHSCKNFKIFYAGVQHSEFHNTSRFNCTDRCPITHEYEIKEITSDNKLHSYCSSSNIYGSSNNGILISVSLLVVSIVVVGIFILRRRITLKKYEEKRVSSTISIDCNDSLPMQPSNIAPNLTKLRIIEDSEIQRGSILGMGEFGKVYRGLWLPEGESATISIAIKVLISQKGSESSKEFLDEVYIMASIEHPNLLKLYAICMTSELMLITQLMPLGCLLQYVKRNHEKISARDLLNWSTQIAKGMSYLENRRLVHRDLAARNVLVQNKECVKITDFGLAKLLDYDSDMYHAGDGKVPIKWLAVECIRHRVYTSKSDVWAFGVTIWELLNFGLQPYKNVNANCILELIESGRRLPQPDICSLDVYCILLRCWILDADSRPTFKELVEQFNEKTKDPDRFLNIPGNQVRHGTQGKKIEDLSPIEGDSRTLPIDGTNIPDDSRQNMIASKPS